MSQALKRERVYMGLQGSEDQEAREEEGLAGHLRSYPQLRDQGELRDNVRVR